MSTSPTRTRSTARILVVLVAVITAVGALLADYLIPASADQHLHNAAWPPHAKFHDAQYIVMSILLGALALILLLRPGVSRARIDTACAILTVPWLGLLGAFLFPGTAIEDPEFDNPQALGLHPQVLLALVLLVLLGVAVVLNRRVANGGDRRSEPTPGTGTGLPTVTLGGTLTEADVRSLEDE
ncbi:DUF6640 family protein [Nocardia sp. AG03]|uniref:DUF6640 family protein n=1 Tax=Nocardia sp. AG03 TaxID=3025312 RepID=UPI0024187720|nr:DUF6640 family protein [Nocardia sp. AG03]